MTEEILSKIKLKLRGFNLVLTGVYKLKVTNSFCHMSLAKPWYHYAVVIPECNWELVGAYPFMGETRFVFFSIYNGDPVYCLFGNNPDLDFIVAKIK